MLIYVTESLSYNEIHVIAYPCIIHMLSFFIQNQILTFSNVQMVRWFDICHRSIFLSTILYKVLFVFYSSTYIMSDITDIRLLNLPEYVSQLGYYIK